MRGADGSGRDGFIFRPLAEGRLACGCVEIGVFWRCSPYHNSCFRRVSLSVVPFTRASSCCVSSFCPGMAWFQAAAGLGKRRSVDGFQRIFPCRWFDTRTVSLCVPRAQFHHCCVLPFDCFWRKTWNPDSLFSVQWEQARATQQGEVFSRLYYDSKLKEQSLPTGVPTYTREDWQCKLSLEQWNPWSPGACEYLTVPCVGAAE